MPGKILIVDDEPTAARLFRQKLRGKIEQQHELLFAFNGEDALNILARDTSIDVVLSDISMPRMDGLTMLEKIKVEHPRIKTIIVSGHGEIANIRKAMNLGAYDFITKPIDFNDLATTIEKTFEEIKLQEKLEIIRQGRRKNPPASTSTNNRVTELNRILLIVHDSNMVTDLTHMLEGLYRVQVAASGEIGIQMALELVPDLIVSDVVMPMLKRNPITSHIPIILLIAHGDHRAKSEGISHGADAALVKPFDRQDLLLRIEELVKLRQLARERTVALQDLDRDESELEDQVIVELKRIVHQHIQKDNFGIHEVCHLMKMSRTQLHRKIKALSGSSTSLFIRRIRLLEARKQLTSSKKNISEIAYQVGFKDPRYFSTCFSKEFGMSPRHFREHQKRTFST